MGDGIANVNFKFLDKGIQNFDKALKLHLSYADTYDIWIEIYSIL